MIGMLFKFSKSITAVVFDSQKFNNFEGLTHIDC